MDGTCRHANTVHYISRTRPAAVRACMMQNLMHV